jgi:hypothetical protein
MKITAQTSDELILKADRGFNIVFSIGFMLFGVAFGYMMYLSGTRGNALAIPIVPFAIGLLWFLFVPATVVGINKTNGQIVYQKKRMVGTKISNYAIADVVRVETRKWWKVENVGQQQRQGFSVGGPMGGSRRELELMMQSMLVFKDGKELALDMVHGGSPGLSTASSSTGLTQGEASVAKRVADFLGVPFQEIEPPQLNNVSTFGSNGTIQS